MKTIEKKIQKIEEIYSKMDKIKVDSSTMDIYDYNDVLRFSELCKEQRKCESTAHRLITQLMKDFDLKPSSRGKMEFKNFKSYGYRETFYELKSRWNRAKEILSGYDKYSYYTQPKENDESLSA